MCSHKLLKSYCHTVIVLTLQVKGLAVLGDYLYVVYHKLSTVYVYNKTEPYDQHSAVNMVVLTFPRGMAASQKHQSIYVTDWNTQRAGRLWCISHLVKTVIVLVCYLPISQFNLRLVKVKKGKGAYSC